MDNPATLALALLGLSGVALVAQQKPKPAKAAAPDQTNVLNCVKGLSGCDISVLSPNDIKQVSESSRKRNLDYCMEGETLCRCV